MCYLMYLEFHTVNKQKHYLSLNQNQEKSTYIQARSLLDGTIRRTYIIVSSEGHYGLGTSGGGS